MAVEIYASFQSQAKERFVVLPMTSVKGLKVAMEERWGVPSELLSVQHQGRVLDKEIRTLEDEGVVHLSELLVSTDVWWSKVVSLSMSGDVGSLRRRVSVAMQQVTPSNRTFVSLFVAAFHGHAQSVSAVLKSSPDFDLTTATQVTRRTVLHAAMQSGNVRCVEEIRAHSDNLFSELLKIPDRSGRTATELVLNHSNRAQMISYLHGLFYDVDVPASVADKAASRIQIENMTKLLDTAAYSRNQLHWHKPVGTCIAETGENLDVTNDESENRPASIRDLSSNPTSPRLLLRPQSPKVSPLPSRPEHAQTLAIKAESLPKEAVLDHGYKCEVSSNWSSTCPAIEETHPASQRQRRRGSALIEPLPDHYAAAPEPPSTPKPASGSNELNLKSMPVGKRQLQTARPVAGVLVAAPRKVSSTRPRSSVSGRPTAGGLHLPSGRPASAATVALSTDASSVSSSASEGTSSGQGEKTRRISLIHKSQAKAFSPDSSSEDSTTGVNPITASVIEIEKERIEKPWNNWIKAITVEADSDDATRLASDPEPSLLPDVKASDKPRDRKTSFDQWVLRKTQLEVAQRSLQVQPVENRHPLTDKGKTFEEWKRDKAEREMKLKELEERKSKEDSEAHANLRRKISFETWKKEKEEHERGIKVQHSIEGKHTDREESFAKGKTYEEWRREDEERRAAEHAAKLEKLKKDKEETEQKQQQRRKQSVASYQKWLKEKEMEAAEDKQRILSP